MKRPLCILAALGVSLVACAPAAPPVSSLAPGAPAAAPEQESAVPISLPDGPVAPELTNDTWLNSEPLRFANMRGKVALVDFWTFG